MLLSQLLISLLAYNTTMWPERMSTEAVSASIGSNRSNAFSPPLTQIQTWRLLHVILTSTQYSHGRASVVRF